LKNKKKEVRLEKEEAQKYTTLKAEYDELQFQLKLFQLFHNKKELADTLDDFNKKTRTD